MVEQVEQEEQEEGGDKASTRGRPPPSATATTHPAAGAGGELQEVEKEEREEIGAPAQLAPAIPPLQEEEGLLPLQEDTRPLQEDEGPTLPTPATHLPQTLLEMATPHLQGLLGATTLLPQALLGLDILLHLITVK